MLWKLAGYVVGSIVLTALLGALLDGLSLPR